jgi:hypothetical protein
MQAKSTASQQAIRRVILILWIEDARTKYAPV